MVKDYLITGPFGFWTQIDHSKTGLVWYSDGHCTAAPFENQTKTIFTISKIQ
jgi:hypothetical protein